MKKIIYILHLVFFTLAYAPAQNPLQKDWDYRYGGTGQEELKTFIQARDGGYVLGGISASGLGGDKTQSARGGTDYWVVKVDRNGLKQWDRRFGGSRDDELHAVQQTADGGYILGGFSKSGMSGDKTQTNWDTSSANPSNDYWIVKIDSMGNKQWDRRFGGIWDDQLYAIQQTADKGYILGGYSLSSATGDRTQPTWGSMDYWIVRTDSLGHKLWDKRFGGTNNDQLYALKQTSDGGFLLGGYSWSGASGDKSQANSGAANYCDFWIVKTDAIGNKQWDRRYGGDDNDELYGLIQTNDGGYVLAGYSWSGISGEKTVDNFGPAYTSDFWILKIDASGNPQWDRAFGGGAREDEFGNISQTTDRGFLIAGTSYSGISGNKSENNLGYEQSWMIRTDSTGNRVWDKTIFTAGHDEAGFALRNRDGSYVVANFSNAGAGGYKTQQNRDTSRVTYDYWLVRFKDTTFIPQANFSAASRTVCPKTCVDFTNTSLYGDSYRWIFNGAIPATSTEMNPHNICYNNSGTFDVTLIVTNGNGSDTLTMHQYVTVYPSPQPFNIMQSGDTLFAPQGYALYQWYYAGMIINGANDYYLVTNQNGNYTVLVSDPNGCPATSGLSNVITSAGALAINSDVDIYPNPNYSKFTLKFSAAKPVTAKVELLSAASLVVFSKEFRTVMGENKVEISNLRLPGGIYYLLISERDHSMMKRVIVEAGF